VRQRYVHEIVQSAGSASTENAIASTLSREGLASPHSVVLIVGSMARATGQQGNVRVSVCGQVPSATLEHVQVAKSSAMDMVFVPQEVYAHANQVGFVRTAQNTSATSNV